MKMRKPQRLDSSGFTLLELLIAMVILAFGLMGVSGMILTSVKGNAFGNKMMQATSLAQDKIEEMRNRDYRDLYKTCGSAGYPVVCADPPANMALDAAGVILVAANDGGTNGDELTGGGGDGFWTYKYASPPAASPLPAGMTLVWGVKRNYPQPRLIWLTACVVWGGTGAANECNLATHANKNIHVVRIESVMGSF
ncbi:MAG: prepilin-type N-terminal cleavage/methylation domain-containing protein [Nitrospirae bacterium]|nr:prepilin-type N-terminal cleavage/methylation domain-containing protein [Nitrospirota bacterium]